MSTRLFTSFAILVLTAAIGAQTPVRTPTQLVRNDPDWYQQGMFGNQAQGLEDFDGDGVPDYAVSAPNYPQGTFVGRVYIYSGRTGTIIQTFDGTQTSSKFGHALADVGDVDGDGTRDLAISTPGYDGTAPGANHGRIQVFSGATGLEIWALEGSAGGGELGDSMRAVGPVIGTRSLVATQKGWSSPTLAGIGRVVGISAITGLITGWADGIIGYGGLGQRLAADPGVGGIYAVDGQGRVWSVTPGLGGNGSVSLEYTSPFGGNVLASIAVLPGPTVGSARIAVGWQLGDSNGLGNNGVVLVYPVGSPTPVLQLDGPWSGGFFGQRVARARDVDGDGVEDIVVLGSGTNLIEPNLIRVHSQTGAIIDEARPGAANNSVLTSIGDVTGDGRDEWINAIGTGSTPTFTCSIYSLGLEATESTGPTGTTWTFTLDGGPLHANASYIQGYGASGAAPGVVGPAPWPLIPLNPDALTDLIPSLAGSVFLPNPFGTLDGAGRRTTTLFLPTATVMALDATNTDLTTTWIAAGPVGGVAFAGNPVTLDF
ncbi:MAG: hypothetical protein CMJ83_10085 [Planctomycetes bacterium]|nr:hypothetical protein [Planctomycetota bacterium]